MTVLACATGVKDRLQVGHLAAQTLQLGTEVTAICSCAMRCRSNVLTIHLPNPVHRRQPLHSGMCLANVEAGAVKGLLSPLPIEMPRQEASELFKRHCASHMT